MNTACKGECLEFQAWAGSLIALAGLLLVIGQTVPAPFIHIDPIANRYAGDRFTITATTSLPEGEAVLFEVYSSSSSILKNQAGQFSSVTGTVKVVKGDGNLNRLSFDVDTATFTPDEYIVTAEAVNQNASHTVRFMLLEPAPATPIPQTTTATPATTVMPARFIRIDPIGDRYSGDRFAITATTSLPEGEAVLFQVYPYSSLLQKSQTGQFPGVTGSVKVVKGDGALNRLSFEIDTSQFTPDEYLVTAEALNQGASHTVRFMLLGIPSPGPFIRIDPVGTRYAGTRFTITATTSLPEGEAVLFEVSPSFSAPHVNLSGRYPGASGSARVTKGDGGLNILSFDVDATPLVPGGYKVTAKAAPHAATGTALFDLLPPATAVQPDGSIPSDLIIPAAIISGAIVIGAIPLIRTGSLSPGRAGSGQGSPRAVEPDVSIAIRRGIEPGAHMPGNIDIRVDVEAGIERSDGKTEGR